MNYVKLQTMHLVPPKNVPDLSKNDLRMEIKTIFIFRRLYNFFQIS